MHSVFPNCWNNASASQMGRAWEAWGPYWGGTVVPAAHTPNVIMAWLTEKFGERLVSFKAEEKCTPHWPDMIPLLTRFIPLWGHQEEHLPEIPVTIADLNAAINEKIQSISQEQCAHVINNLAHNNPFNWTADIWSMYSRAPLDIFVLCLR